MLLNLMAAAIPQVGAGTPLGQALAKAVSDIGRHVPPGSASPQGENNYMREMMQKRLQSGSQMAALGAAGGQPPRPGMPQPQPQAA
jgi:hypothetical protein